MIFRIVSFEDFGDVHNPLWHIRGVSEFYPDPQIQSWNPSLSNFPNLVAFESLSKQPSLMTAFDPHSVQIQLSLSNLGDLENACELKVPVQVWLDRPLTDQQVASLKAFQSKIQIILVPFSRWNLMETANLLKSQGFHKIGLLFQFKSNSFDGFLSVPELFHLMKRLQDFEPQLKVTPIMAEAHWVAMPKELKLFCVEPTLTNLEIFLATENSSQFFFFKIAKLLNTISFNWISDLLLAISNQEGPEILRNRIEGTSRSLGVKVYWSAVKIIGLLKILMIRTYWVFYTALSRIYYFTKNILLFPFLKIYWFLKFQIEKRILKKGSRGS